MKNIKLMADYRCFPLWEADPGVFGDISPDSLPISKSLRDALLAWANEYDRTLDPNDPSDAGFDSQPSADQFVATGFKLLDQLQTELGPSSTVVYNFKAYP